VDLVIYFWVNFGLKYNSFWYYLAKIQRVERGITKSFYINIPAALAEACNIEKSEEMEWLVEDKNTFILQRIKKQPPRKTKEKKSS
jgi:bifunctional DNA-binding transcriptional regulator/antitoxin component of YhaV-PrlF toxin-antitoxin module